MLVTAASDGRHSSQCPQGPHCIWGLGAGQVADSRNLLGVLKAELDFLEKGGYRSTGSSSWRPQFIFEDSPTCLNPNAPAQRRPCSECVLMQLVPPERNRERVPCRHIRLNEQGETLDSLYRSGTPEEIEATVAKWLRAKIQELEGARKAKSARGQS